MKINFLEIITPGPKYHELLCEHKNLSNATPRLETKSGFDLYNYRPKPLMKTTCYFSFLVLLF